MESGASKLQPTASFGPLPLFINKVLLERPLNPFYINYGSFHST